MEVVLAKSAGFCYGVHRAVEMTEQAAVWRSRRRRILRRNQSSPQTMEEGSLPIWKRKER